MSLHISGRWLRFAILLVSGPALAGCRATKLPGETSLPAAAVSRVGHASLSNHLEVAGEFLPFQEVEIHAKVAGYIRKIYVDIGDHVHAGQLLAVLDVPEMTAQVEGAQAGVQRSQEEILRARSAVARAEADHAALHAASQRLQQASAIRPGLIAQQELDDAQAKDMSSGAQVEAAKSELSAMEQALGAAQAEHRQYASLADYSHITAPFDGSVTWRYADTGALLQAGTSNAGSMPVLKVAQVNVLRLRLPVPEALAQYVRIGDEAKIHVQANGQELKGKVVRTTGELDLSTRSLQVEIDVPNGDGKLAPGMYADVTLDIERSANGLTVPVEAVDRSATSPVVLVVDDKQRIEKRTVKLGMETPNLIEVVEGLHEGERVVVANLASFHPGEAVDARETAGRTIATNASNGER